MFQTKIVEKKHIFIFSNCFSKIVSFMR